MQQFPQNQSFPFHLIFPLLNQGNFLGLHFPTPYHGGFHQLPQFNQINSQQIEEESKKSSIPGSGFRKSFRKKRGYKKKSKSSDHNHGRWTVKEEKLYLDFINDLAPKNPDWFDKVSGQKRQQYFISMSDFIGTRTSDQCKSKDQKMQKREDLCGKKDFFLKTSHSPSNPSSVNKIGISQGDFDEQNYTSFLERYFASRSNEGFSFETNSVAENHIQSVDIFFDFGTKQGSHQALKPDFDDHLDNY